MRARIVPFFLALLSAGSASALSHSRAYTWGFQNGNLIPNWSFENPLAFWMEDASYGFTVQSRFKASGIVPGDAKSGAFVAKVSGTYPGGGSFPPLSSDLIPIQPGQAYTLSFYYQSSGSLTATVRPKFVCSSARDLSQQTTPFFGSYYSAQSSWTLYTQTFTAPSNTQYGLLALAEFNSAGSGTFYFDDVVLEEGALSPDSVLAHRQAISQATAFSDGLGRTHQSQVRIGTNRYLLTGTGFDSFARPDTAYLAVPYDISSAPPPIQTGLLANAQNYYGSAGPFNARGYPYSRTTYAEEPGTRVVESTSPDSAWQYGKNHTDMQSSYFVQDTLVPANIINPSAVNAECKYRLDWGRDPDSTFTLTWTNKLGQVVRKAVNLTRSSSGANTWKWSATRYEYYRSGALKRVWTPLDDSAGTSSFAEISEYDAQGRLISSFSPDRNLRKFWYNRAGQLRYSQDEEQRAAGEFTYLEYDAGGRLLSQGVQTGLSGPPPQDSVDLDTYSQGTKIEQVGYIYDDTATFQSRTGLATFQSRTGFPLQAIMGTWKTSIALRNAPGKLLCKYNKNLDNIAPGFSAQERLVADFYSYDDDGRLETQWKYMGAVKSPCRNLQDAKYLYDAQGRMLRFQYYACADSAILVNEETYHYDALGRVDTVRGIGGKPLARYTYGDWGPLSKVTLGGTAAGDSATAVEYAYHSQGGVKEIRATGLGSKRIFQQLLGYETRAYEVGGVPALIQPRFGGAITQQVYKYTSDLNALKPVRALNYGYDQGGRMLKAQGYWNTNASPLDGNEAIVGSTLTMGSADSLSSLMDYDLNGRIKGQRSAGASSADSARYSYASNSYRLDHVTGKLSAGSTRNLSPSGTFVYDNNGALLQDKSKRMKAVYGWDGMAEAFTVDSAAAFGAVRCCLYDLDSMPAFFKVKNPTREWHNFYDADGNRVTRVEVENPRGLRLSSVSYVTMAAGTMLEWEEDYGLSGKIKRSQAVAPLKGVAGVIGRIRPDGKYEFYLKNHLGSTMYTVDDRGRYGTGTQRAMDYLAYGPYRLLKAGSDTTDVKQKFTGKELEGLTGLYAFGARWYDPDLGMWMSADPAKEFANPYSYVGGNVVNLIDPFGLYSWTRFWRDTEGVGATVLWNAIGGTECGLTVGSNCDFGYVTFKDNGNISHAGWYGVHGFMPGGVVDPADAGISYSGQYHANDNMAWLGEQTLINGEHPNTGEGWSFSVTISTDALVNGYINRQTDAGQAEYIASGNTFLLGIGMHDWADSRAKSFICKYRPGYCPEGDVKLHWNSTWDEYLDHFQADYHGKLPDSRAYAVNNESEKRIELFGRPISKLPEPKGVSSGEMLTYVMAHELQHTGAAGIGGGSNGSLDYPHYQINSNLAADPIIAPILRNEAYWRARELSRSDPIYQWLNGSSGY